MTTEKLFENLGRILLYKHAKKNSDGFTAGQVKWIMDAMQEYAISYHMEQSKWIVVNEQEPENFQTILVTNGKAIIAGGYYKENGKFCANSMDNGTIYCCDLEKFTHWRPLPENPIKK